MEERGSAIQFKGNEPQMKKLFYNSLISKIMPLILALSISLCGSLAVGKPLKIEINKGIIEPLPLALPSFVAENNLSEIAENLTSVIIGDLQGTGLFKIIEDRTLIFEITNFNNPIRFSDWKTINSQALLVGAVSSNGTTNITVKFRLFDVFSETQIGNGLKFSGPKKGWRRIAHKIADEVYSRLTGEQKYFDSRVAFVAQEGPKNNLKKRLVLMDYDGANQVFLTNDENFLVLAPRFSPNGNKLLFTSYESGSPQIYLLDIRSRTKIILQEKPGTMSFSSSFSPNGEDIVFSLSTGTNTDIYKLNIASNSRSRLTSSVAIDTAPSFSPDGSKVVFESDRSGTQQLYIMPSNGGNAKRISFGKGSYGTPFWAPKGNLIAFTKQSEGFFHIGTMTSEGLEETLLTTSFLDEGPTWSPNGRVIMFTREISGSGGSSTLYSVDITGRNLKPVRANSSDPSWSKLLN